MSWEPYADLSQSEAPHGRPVLRLKLKYYQRLLGDGRAELFHKATCYFVPNGRLVNGILVVFHPFGVHVENWSESSAVCGECRKPFVEQTGLMGEDYVLIYPHWGVCARDDNWLSNDLLHMVIDWLVMTCVLHHQIDRDVPVFWVGSGEGGEMAQVLAQSHGGDGVYAIGCSPVFYDWIGYPLYIEQLAFDDSLFESVWRDTVKLCSKCEEDGGKVYCSLVDPFPPYWSVERSRAAIEFLSGNCKVKCLGVMRERLRRDWYRRV